MSINVEQLVGRLRNNPNDTEAYSALKSYYRESGDLESLVSLLAGRAEYATDNAEAVQSLQEAGEAVLEGLNDPSRAMDLFQQALARNPFCDEASERIQSLLDGWGEHQKLAGFLINHIRILRSVDADPRYLALLHFRLGEVLSKQLGRPEKALGDYQRAAELDPSLLIAIYEAREILLDRGDLPEACRLYELEADGEEDSERKVGLLAELARLKAEQLGDIEGAVEALRKASAAAPGDTQVMHELATLLLKRAEALDEEGAAADYRRAAELFYRIAQSVPEDRAIQYLESALGYAPYHDGALDMLEEIAERSGQADILPVYWVAYVTSGQEGPEVDRRRLRLAEAYQAAGQIDDAIVCVEPVAKQGNRQAAELLERLYTAAGGSAAEGGEEVEPVRGERRRSFPPEQRELEADSEQEQERAGPTAPPKARAEAEGVSRIARLAMAAKESVAARDIDQAATYYREILGLDPSDPEAFSFLEVHYRKKRDFVQLKDLLLSSARAPGLSMDARKLRLREVAGICETRLKDTEGAIEAWRAVAALDPADGEASSTLKRLLEKTRNWGELVQILDREALSATDTNVKAELIAQIAQIHRDRCNDYAEAAEAYRQLYSLKPEDRGVRDLLCDCLLEVERYEDALPLMQERIDEADDDKAKLRLLRTLANIYEERIAAPEEAFAAYKRILELSGKDRQALDRMEQIDRELGRFDRMLETLARRVEVSTKAERQELFVRMGTIAGEELSDPDRSARYFAQALELAPRDNNIMGSLISALGSAGRYDEALNLLQEHTVMEKRPERRIELLRRTAQLQAEGLGNEEAAADTWRSVLDIKDDVEALRFLRVYEEKRGDPVQLVNVLKRLAPLEQDPIECRDLMLDRAEILHSKLDRSKEATPILLQVIQLDPECEPAVELLAEAAEKVGDYRGMVKALERKLAASEQNETKIELVRRLADVYENELRDDSEATKALKSWVQLDPADVEPRRRLVGLLTEAQSWTELLADLDALAGLETEAEKRSQATVSAAEVAFRKLADAGGAWKRLAPLVQRGEKAAEEAIHKLARATEREEMLAGLYVSSAQETEDSGEQGEYWRKAAQVYDEYLDNSKQALEASLRMFATDLDNRVYLDEVDRLAVKAKAWERLGQVYNRLLRKAESPEEKIELLTRYADILDREAQETSEALDHILRACALDPADEQLLAKAEDLGVRANRCEELLLVYDRRRARSEEPVKQVELLLRAAKLSDDALKDRERTNTYIKQALGLTEAAPDAYGSILDAVRQLDAGSGKDNDQEARRTFIRAHREIAERARPEFGSKLIMDAARIVREEFNDEEGVFDVLRHGTSLLPTNASLQDELEDLARKINRLDALDAHLARLVDEALDSQTTIFLLERRGRLLEETLSRYGEAAEVYSKMMLIDPDHCEAPRRLHACLKESGRYQDLLLAIDRRLARASDEQEKVGLQKEVALIWENELKNRWEALDAWQAVAELDPGDSDAQAAVQRLQRRSLLPPEMQDENLFDEEPAAPEEAKAFPDRPAATDSGEQTAVETEEEPTGVKKLPEEKPARKGRPGKKEKRGRKGKTKAKPAKAKPAPEPEPVEERPPEPALEEERPPEPPLGKPPEEVRPEEAAEKRAEEEPAEQAVEQETAPAEPAEEGRPEPAPPPVAGEPVAEEAASGEPAAEPTEEADDELGRLAAEKPEEMEELAHAPLPQDLMAERRVEAVVAEPLPEDADAAIEVLDHMVEEVEPEAAAPITPAAKSMPPPLPNGRTGPSIIPPPPPRSARPSKPSIPPPVPPPPGPRTARPSAPRKPPPPAGAKKSKSSKPPPLPKR